MLLESDDEQIGRVCPTFVIFKMDAGKPAPTKRAVRKICAANNYDHVECIYLVFAAQDQCYRVESLGPLSPHVQLTKKRVTKIRKGVDLANTHRTSSNEPLITIVDVPANVPFSDSFLQVAHASREDVARLKPLEMLRMMVDAPLNRERNNRCKNWGMKGWNSSDRRQMASLGMSRPGHYRGTKDPAMQRFVKFSADLLRNTLPGFGGDYTDDDRRKEFAEDYLSPLFKLGPHENFPDAVFFALNYLTKEGGKPSAAGLLNGHCDPNNDDITPTYEPVSSVSFLVRDHNNDLLRLVAIAYGKKAGGQYMVKRKKFLPVLELCLKKHRSLASLLTTTDPKALLPDPSNSMEKKNGKFHRSGINLNKTFMYGMFADVIGKFMLRHPHLREEPMFLISLIWLTSISHQVQIYVHEVNHLSQDDTMCVGGRKISSFKKHEWGDFAIALHKHLCAAKADKRKRCWDYSVSSRHQPCNNVPATDNQVINSVRVLRLMLHCVNQVKKDLLQADPVYYHSRINHRLSQACEKNRVVMDTEELIGQGCHGTGPFNANHTIMVAAYCGAVDVGLHGCTSIAQNTGTDNALVKRFGFDRFGGDNEELLKCLMNCRKFKGTDLLNRHQAEELVCHSLQAEPAQSGNRGPAKKIGWRYGDKLGILDGKGRCAYRLRNGEVERAPLLMSPGLRNWEEAGKLSPALYFDMPNQSGLPRRKHRGSRQARQPLVADEIPALEGGSNHFPLVRLIHPEKLCMREKQPRDAVLNFETLHQPPRTVTVTSCGAIKEGSNGGVLHNPNRKRRKRKRAPELDDSDEDDEDTSLLTDTTGIQLDRKFFAYSVKLPPLAESDGPTIKHPAADFPLRHAYPSNSAGTIVLSGVRFFSDENEAKAYALLWGIHTHPGHYAVTRFGRRFLEPPIPDRTMPPLDGYENEDGFVIATKCGGRGGHRIAFRTYGISDSRVPHVVQVTSSTGSLMLYLCDTMWQCDSGVIVFPSRPTLCRNVGGDEGVLAGIASHRRLGGCNQVQVVWADGQVSWEPLSAVIKAAPHHARQYGIQMGMEGELGWRKVTTGPSHKSEFDGYPQFEVTYQTIRGRL